MRRFLVQLKNNLAYRSRNVGSGHITIGRPDFKRLKLNKIHAPAIKRVIVSQRARPWLSFVAGAMILVVVGNLLTSVSVQFAQGAYTTSSTDADGNTHLGSNTVNDTYVYDTTTDSDPGTQQQLGVDPNWKNGVSRKSYALGFNGSTQYINGSLSISSNTFTIEAWVRPSALPSSSNQVRLVTLNSNSSTSQHFIDIDNNATNTRFRMVVNGSNVARGATAISTAAWYHVVGIYDGTDIRLYVNGTLDAETSYTTAATATTGYNIARDPSNAKYFNGIVDEVRISSVARYGEGTVGNQVFTAQRRFQEDSNTQVLLHMDEGTGTSTTSDSSQNNNDGTLNSITNASWYTGNLAIMDGFDGSQSTSGNQTGAGNITLASNSSTTTTNDSYETRITGSSAVQYTSNFGNTSLGNGATLEPGSTGTIEAWVNPSTSSETQFAHMIGKRQNSVADPYDIDFGTSTNRLRGGIASSSTANYTPNDSGAAAQVPSNQWSHVALVWRGIGSTVDLYLNGVVIASVSQTINPATGTGNATIGATLSSGGSLVNNFLGSIDEVRFSNTARYASGAVGAQVFTPSRRFGTDSNTMGLWHFDEGVSTTANDSSGNGNTGTLAGAGNSWVEGIATAANISPSTSSTNWNLPGYSFRKQIKTTNSSSNLPAGYAIETTEDRAAKLDNKQTLPSGNDWRVMYQPSNATEGLTLASASSQYVRIPYNTSINNISDSIATVEAWVKPTANPCSGGDTEIIWSSFTTNHGFQLYLKDGKPTAWSDTALSVQSPTSICDSTWHHVAAVWDGSNNTIFVDGQNMATASSKTFSTGWFDSQIGIECDGANSTSCTPNYFNGSIDELRVSHSVRYTTGFTPSLTPFQPDSNTVGLWHLDEGSGTAVVDASSNANNGILTNGSPTWTSSAMVSTTREIPRFIPHGHSVSVSGSGSYIRNSTALFSNGAFTIEGWVKPTSVSGTQTIAAIGATSTAAPNILIRLSGSSLQGYVDGGTVILSGGTVTANTWNHVALVYDTNKSPKTALYLNGSRVATDSTASANYSGIANFTTGGSSKSTPDNLLTGQLDEMRVSSIARYTSSTFSTTTTPYANDGNTLLLWHLDDGSSTTAASQTGSSQNGTITSGTWVTNGGKVDSVNETQFKLAAPISATTTDTSYYLYYGNPNESGSAQSYNSYGLVFNNNNGLASSAYATVPNANAPSISSALTISAWVYINGSAGIPTCNTALNNAGNCIIAIKQGTTNSSTADWGLIWTRNSPHTNHIDFGLKTSGNSAWTDYYSASTFSLNTWHHIVVTYTSGAITLYVDGTADTVSGPPTGTISSSGGPLEFGHQDAFGSGNNGEEFMKGKINEVRVYNRVLSSTEVTNLYSNTPAVSNSGLVGYWKFDDMTPGGTTASDSSATGANATLTGFTFDSVSNWEVEKNFLAALAEPSSITLVTTAEQESPIFYQWRNVSPTGTASSWSCRYQITTAPTQLTDSCSSLSASGVYISFNPNGIYSRYDYYHINSWAVQAFSSTRGNLRSFPTKANIIADGAANGVGYIDIIDASTNKLWARFTGATNNIIPSATTPPLQVVAKNGRIYIATASGLIDIQMDLDTAQIYKSTGNSAYGGNIANRNGAAAYASVAGSTIASNTVNDVAVNVKSNKQYVAIATSSGMNLIQGETGYTTGSSSGGTVLLYSKNAGNAYTHVALTSQIKLYGANSSIGGLDRYDAVDADSGNQSTSSDATYTSSTTPALAYAGNVITDISVTEGTSTSDGTSNTVAISAAGSGNDVDVIQENSTFASGTIRHFTASNPGSSNWNNKQFNNALFMNSSSNNNTYVNVANTVTGGNPFEFDLNNSFTLEAWIAPSDTTSRVIMSKYGGSNVGYDLRLTNISGNYRLTADIQASTSLYIARLGTATNFTAGKWYHVAMVFTGGTNGNTISASNIKLFVNGVEESSYDDTNSSSGSGTTMTVGTNHITIGQNFRIGSRSLNVGEFYGLIDEVRVSNVARYSANFTVPSSPYTTDSNTVGLYHFDEPPGATIAANSTSSGQTYDGTLTNSAGTIYFTSPVFGGNAVTPTSIGLGKSGTPTSYFNDGGSDYAEVGDAANLRFTTSSNFTIEAWIKSSGIGIGTANVIAGKYTGSNAGYFLSLLNPNAGTCGTNTCLYFQVQKDASNYIYRVGTTNIGDGKWHHVTGVYTGSGGTVASTQLRMFVDGREQSYDTTTSGTLNSMNTTSGNFEIGRRADNSGRFNGGIDEVRVSNTARYTTSFVPPNRMKYDGNTVSLWHFDEGSGTSAADSSSNAYTATLTSALWGTGSPAFQQGFFIVGTDDGSSGNNGAATLVDLNTLKQLIAFTSSTSGMPNNDVDSVGIASGSGPVALIGTKGGAYATGFAGFIVFDAATTPATTVNTVRVKGGGTTRIKGGGTVRVKPAT